MLYLVTGTPGAGKSQFVIDYVRSNEQLKGRPVYYWGIPELSESLGWHMIGADTFDQGAAAKWHELVPDGAVVVVDEAHKVWPRKPPGGAEPPNYAVLGTTRHRGLTVIAITQYPAHVDTSYRGRVERHWHLERKLGWQRTFVLEFDGAKNPEDRSARELAISKSYYKFKPEVWKLYKSATVHNVERRKLPLKLLIIPVGLFVVVGLFSYVYHYLTSKDLTEGMAPAGSAIEGEAPALPPGMSPGVAAATPQARAQVYLSEWVPAIPKQPWTAPAYDGVRNVVSYPRPQCILGVAADGVERCWCYTQQASRMDVSEAFCRGVVELGYFDPGIPDQYLAANEREYRPPPEQERREPTFTVVPSRVDDGPQIDTRAAMERVRQLRQQ